MAEAAPDGGQDGDCIRVDTTVLDEAVERVSRAAEDAVDAGSGLDRLTVAGVAVGGQALHDALADLVRLWTGRLDRTGTAARGLAGSLREARWQYAATEHTALTAAVEPWGIPLLPGVEEWLAEHRRTGPGGAASPSAAEGDGPR